ncbi:MAG: hypothetical protein HN353_04060 [Bdellovibrionales bacterium]|jgi:hypothetical protein|nr:hypothetical protein [Bdellovibrionales bacterium]MBT3526543.1 hypothetical protein [Bdellovibrionales bacterium]MBT7669607.1 hypothetical protein [Bdellovibrionales bacterium]MBT7766511.1 hypothetical protein [Bdellovibrionales bacterium]
MKSKRLQGLVLTILLLSSGLLHGYPYLHYDPNKTKLTASSFSRYVRPQVRSIINDFFHMISKLGMGERQLIKIRQSLVYESDQFNRWPARCHSQTSESEKHPEQNSQSPTPANPLDCQQRIAKIYHSLSTLEHDILSLQSNSLIITSPDKKKKSRRKSRRGKKSKVAPIFNDRLIKVHTELNQLALMLYSTLHLIEERLITFNTPYALHSKAVAQIRNNLDEMILISERVMLNRIDQGEKRELNVLWYGMIKKMEQRVLKKGGRRYLLNNLESFNLIWNSFCMKQTKWDKPKSSVVTLIKTIHLRWNSILKVILR